eukprot:gene9778-10621_t
MNFPTDGIQLSFFLNEFPHLFAINDMTTNQFCQTYILTMNEQISYADLIKRSNPSRVKKANLFISHVWEYRFSYVIDTLRDHFSRQNNSNEDSLDHIYIWFDVLCNNQHFTQNLHFNWWSETFKSAIEEFHHTIVIFDHWENPILLHRAWCLYEIYCTAITNSTFEIAMRNEEKIQFLEKMKINNCKELLDHYLSTIDVTKSRSTIPEDKKRIFAVIESSIGDVEKINAIVLKKIRGWLLRLVEEESINLKFIVGEVYHHAGKFDEAQFIYRDCYLWRKEHLGENHLLTLHALHNYADTLYDTAHYHEGKMKAEECYNRRKDLLSERHIDTLKSLNLLGLFCERTEEDLISAEGIHSQCLELRKELLGEDHRDTLQSTRNLAGIYRRQKKFALSEVLYVESLEKCLANYGLCHPDTLKSFSDLASLLDVEKSNEAYLLHIECVEKSKRIYGNDHPKTVTAMISLANNLSKQGKFQEAENLFIECLEKRKITLSKDHPNILSLMNRIAHFYYYHNRFQDAEKWYRDCYQQRLQVSNLEDEDTLQTYYWLGESLYSLKRYAEARKCWEDCYRMRKETLGKKHKETLKLKSRMDAIPRSLVRSLIF